jgi:hypothetical protein
MSIGGMTVTGEDRNTRNKQNKCHFVCHKHHMGCLELNPCESSERSANNRKNHRIHCTNFELRHSTPVTEVVPVRSQ